MPWEMDEEHMDDRLDIETEDIIKEKKIEKPAVMFFEFHDFDSHRAVVNACKFLGGMAFYLRLVKGSESSYLMISKGEIKITDVYQKFEERYPGLDFILSDIKVY